MQTEPIENAARGEPPASELVAQALSDARELVRLEIRMAKAELKEEISRTKRAAILGAIGGVFVILALATLLIAVVLALGGTAVTALVVAAVLAGLGLASIAVAYASVPKTVLGQTREHLKGDVEQLKEHVV